MWRKAPIMSLYFAYMYSANIFVLMLECIYVSIISISLVPVQPECVLTPGRPGQCVP